MESKNEKIEALDFDMWDYVIDGHFVLYHFIKG